jgi:hypothetical protein
MNLGPACVQCHGIAIMELSETDDRSFCISLT